MRAFNTIIAQLIVIAGIWIGTISMRISQTAFAVKFDQIDYRIGIWQTDIAGMLGVAMLVAMTAALFGVGWAVRNLYNWENLNKHSKISYSFMAIIATAFYFWVAWLSASQTKALASLQQKQETAKNVSSNPIITRLKQEIVKKENEIEVVQIQIATIDKQIDEAIKLANDFMKREWPRNAAITRASADSARASKKVHLDALKSLSSSLQQLERKKSSASDSIISSIVTAQARFDAPIAGFVETSQVVLAIIGFLMFAGLATNLQPDLIEIIGSETTNTSSETTTEFPPMPMLDMETQMKIHHEQQNGISKETNEGNTTKYKALPFTTGDEEAAKAYIAWAILTEQDTSKLQAQVRHHMGWGEKRKSSIHYWVKNGKKLRNETPDEEKPFKAEELKQKWMQTHDN